MKRFAFLLLLSILLESGLSVSAQKLQNIDVTKGLCDRRVFSIQKGQPGYMWFLTYAGIDKFDGKNIKHYPLSSGKGYIDSYSENNTLKTDSRGRPWFITPEGETFVYCQLMDEFQLIELPLEMSNQTFDLVELTSYDEIWYCNRKNIYIYTINTGETKHIELEHEHSRITSVLQISENNYIIGTNETICQAEIQNNILKPKQVITDSFFSPNLLFYHPKYKILFAGSDSHGMLVYDLNLDYIIQTYTNLKDTPISAINYYGDAEILISTQGNGIYRYHLKDHTLESFLRADYSEDNLMLGNNIRTIYTDEEERIWMSVYPIGVSVYDRRYPKYKWTRHQNGNIHSLGDDQVNHILEDSEGDIWYATNDGISLYYKKTKTWHHFFSEKEYTDNPKNSTFLSLCEIRPGYIAAGGHMSGIYGIDKHSLKHEIITSYSINSKQSPQIQNKYIRSIYKDKNGYVWTGGHYYLGCSNRAINFFEHYPIDHPITCIIEKDSVNLFIGTGYGIYLFDRSKKTLTKLRVPFASQFITTLYKHTNDVLYIGTTSSGLVALYPDGKYEIYSYRNSSLISDNVYSIIPYGEDRLIISTEKSLAKFNTKEKKFSNWTVDRGLIEASFNPRAGIHTSENTFIFGTGKGAIEFPDNTKIPQPFHTKIQFDKIYVAHQDFCHELKKRGFKSMDSINELRLAHNQNMFSIELSTINYDTPNHTFIQWRIQEINEQWKRIKSNGRIEKTNLESGEYTLQIQALAEETFQVIENKKLKIVIEPSFWETQKALSFYLIVCGIILFFLTRFIWLRKTQKLSQEKVKFFIETANYLQTPIQLIKSPIKEVLENKQLTQQETDYLKMAVHYCNNLEQSISNLIIAEKQVQGRKILVASYLFDSIIQEYISLIQPITEEKAIKIHFENIANLFTEIWIDKNKIDFIFYSLLIKILKYIPQKSSLHVLCQIENNDWVVEVYSQDEKSLIRRECNLSNKFYPGISIQEKRIKEESIESKLVQQVIQNHSGHLQYGKISYIERCFILRIPLSHISYKKFEKSDYPVYNHTEKKHFLPLRTKSERKYQTNIIRGNILITGNNEEEIAFLETTLANEWNITVAYSGNIALKLIKKEEPDIIISDFKLPDVSIDNFCEILKSNMDTSHIPIVMLASMNDIDSIIHGLNLKVDHYITKPYDIRLVRAILKNIRENRLLLEERLSHVDAFPRIKEFKNAIKEKETKLLAEVKNVIREHIGDEEFTVDKLCSIIGMSRSNLFQKIKTITQQSLNDIVKEIRMQKACEILLSQKYSITEVSEMLGFSDAKYFREVFKKHFGCPPSEYVRNKLKKGD